MSKSKIEWTEETWNPTLGCSKISPGCKHCYAMRVVHRLAGNPNLKVKAANEGLTIIQGGEPNWTGKVRLIPERLEIPLRTRKPTTYFVNSLSDLFHEDLADEDIDRVFAAMALGEIRGHRFQVLTKRAERMKAYVSSAMPRFPDGIIWPIRSVWLGVSVESKDCLHRIDRLRQAPAAVRFLSLEPLLEDLGDISQFLSRPETANRYTGSEHSWTDGEPQVGGADAERHQPPRGCGERRLEASRQPSGAGIDWVIVGGESGPGARPMNPQWVRNIREQCIASGVAFFFKQWGEWAPFATEAFYAAGSTMPGNAERVGGNCGGPSGIDYCRKKGQAPKARWSDGSEMRARVMRCPDHKWGKEGLLDMEYVGVGKKKAGRLLDGRTWDEMPREKLNARNE